MATANGMRSMMESGTKQEDLLQVSPLPYSNMGNVSPHRITEGYGTFGTRAPSNMMSLSALRNACSSAVTSCIIGCSCSA